VRWYVPASVLTHACLYSCTCLISWVVADGWIQNKACTADVQQQFVLAWLAAPVQVLLG